ncbi:hypothetical protein IM40_11285 (plasmid) [Candidatus Paracaedimonas acanthamoebae]|nr:hypothetical protein IM40_11285 [Candidatus Paracaedimonas acanthamoebae]
MIRISGYVLMLCSVFLYSLCEAVGKYLTNSYEPAQIIFFRSSVGMVIVIWVTFFKGVQAYKPQLKLNILRNFFAASGLFLTFFSLKNLSLSSHEFVALMSPIFIALLSAVFLNERLSQIIIISVMLSLLGVIIMLYPFEDFSIGLGLTFAIISTLFNASAAVVTKRLSNVEPLILYSAYIIVCFLTSGLFAYKNLILEVKDLPIFFLVAALHFFAFYFLILAFRKEDLVKLSPLEYTSAIWSVLLGYLFWQYLPSYKELLGGSLIIIGTLFAKGAEIKPFFQKKIEK